MDTSSRTVFIAGGTSGLGLALAESLAAAGSTVVVGGRRTEVLEQIAAEHPGIDTVVIDVSDPVSITAARDSVLQRHPDLDTVVTMSGIMRPEDLRDPSHIDDAEATITTNLLGTIRLVDAFTPGFLERGSGTLVTVTSGIAFAPYPLTPAYGATKAGVHSYTVSLRTQLEGTGVEVVELVPPLVATELMPGQSQVPGALSVEDFTAEVMSLLGTDPTPEEILVERVKRLRFAERDGTSAQLLEERKATLSQLGHR
ncbi:SDR family NAD(P)-dependent oxidoreductase [Nocardioides mangrovicus]|uniref:SDR family NAD(P)-dependent oxidoreductase n=1 Tax=Nocardioides mangrovicus TaxID=2478913 RepID=A0A3L8NZ36_9ACTN|nr:SDR family NAD(P)-dependent oxidoreductase [Nocardioides mangrovicus]RLV48164.1 SDR family NAD(P)-dependent oxidoreductase [Nocardioides mangrovicus]